MPKVYAVLLYAVSESVCSNKHSFKHDFPTLRSPVWTELQALSVLLVWVLVIMFFNCFFIYKHIRCLRLTSTVSVEIEKAFQLEEDSAVTAKHLSRQQHLLVVTVWHSLAVLTFVLCICTTTTTPCPFFSTLHVKSEWTLPSSAAPSQTPLPAAGYQFWSLASLRDPFLGRAGFSGQAMMTPALR